MYPIHFHYKNIDVLCYLLPDRVFHMNLLDLLPNPLHINLLHSHHLANKPSAPCSAREPSSGRRRQFPSGASIVMTSPSAAVIDPFSAPRQPSSARRPKAHRRHSGMGREGGRRAEHSRGLLMTPGRRRLPRLRSRRRGFQNGILQTTRTCVCRARKHTRAGRRRRTWNRFGRRRQHCLAHSRLRGRPLEVTTKTALILIWTRPAPGTR